MEWKRGRDPIQLHSDWMIEAKIAEQKQLEEIRAQLQTEMEQAVRFAIAAPYPSPGEVVEDVYA